MSTEVSRSNALQNFAMENRIGLFVFIFSFLRVAVHSDAISASSDFFLDYDDFGTDIAFYDPEMFNEESESPTSFLDDTDDFNPELFSSSTQDGCVSLMSADDTNLFGMGQEARVRPRAESCPNPGSSTPDTGVPNFGLFNPGSSLFNLMNPPDNPAKPPAQIYPGQPERDLIKEHLERMYQLNNAGEEEDDDEDEDPCPFHLVSDLHIPVCDSGNYAKDVQRIAGEYFFDLFNIRYCMSVPVGLTQIDLSD